MLETEGTDEEEAAALMGAGAFTIFRKITLPHIRWALLYGIVLCTARAMGEFGAVPVCTGICRIIHSRDSGNYSAGHAECAGA